MPSIVHIGNAQYCTGEYVGNASLASWKVGFSTGSIVQVTEVCSVAEIFYLTETIHLIMLRVIDF